MGYLLPVEPFSSCQDDGENWAHQVKKVWTPGRYCITPSLYVNTGTTETDDENEPPVVREGGGPGRGVVRAGEWFKARKWSGRAGEWLKAWEWWGYTFNALVCVLLSPVGLEVTFKECQKSTYLTINVCWWLKKGEGMWGGGQS